MLRDFQMIGRLGRLDEIQMKKQGSRGCEMRIACSDYKDGQETTAWFTVVAFGQTASNVLDMYKVGDQIFLSGTIDLDTWTDKTSGKERTKIKLKAFRSRRIQKGKASQDGDGQAPGQQPAQQNYHQPQGQGYNQNYAPQSGGYQPPQQQGWNNDEPF